MAAIDHLEPTLVWKHFATLCAIPRSSLHEEAIRVRLRDWAVERGLEAETDAAGNLLLRKPASPGKSELPGVILQAHLDMVCQANAGYAHDFTKDPILPVEENGWLMAKHTTLGADNGIGVALALAALEDDSFIHPPLEALFTVDEEVGMGGAHGLAPGWLRGTRLLNLDSEDWGEFYLGCAGGCDVDISRTYETEAVPQGYHWARLGLSGLTGGHSGGEIHLGRGNANKELVRLLRALNRSTDIRLTALSGGTVRNALPREAWAELAVPLGGEAVVQAGVAAHQALLRQELSGVDEGVTLTLTPLEGTTDADRALLSADQKVMLTALQVAPYGVRRMSTTVPGVVETSNNLGVMALKNGVFTANLMVRSLRPSGTEVLAGDIAALFALAGCSATISGGYPGWTPNPDSALLALCRDVFRTDFGQEAAAKVIHAGLECGIIGASYPHLDMVSFGPTIRGAHAPGERVNIATVGQTWQLLKAILEATATG